ncbi:hypothetical protein RIO-1_12 [Pseudoalteromonas phage RIO-1]|uniref:Uncharacterized protein n=1 Tax=Pseudoalteromonas phage RIO-1 TaxID=1316739 RepID=R4JGU0_9CAUD|nr:hypothetical protein RIO-1_12 [Pseudoalteromonas phage RIO-1]AGK87026.1 hypothetical protein RIO-1_12 [Pseudoalteromonas phage RIO-1]
MRRVQEVNEYDYTQYYRGTYVLNEQGELCKVQDVEDDVFILETNNETERQHADSCSVLLPETGYYSGIYISLSAHRTHKKGLQLSYEQARAYRRYLLTGAGFSPFYKEHGYVYYKGQIVGFTNKQDVVILSQEIAKMYSEEYKVEVQDEEDLRAVLNTAA